MADRDDRQVADRKDIYMANFLEVISLFMSFSLCIPLSSFISLSK